MDAMDENLWRLILATMVIFGFHFIILLLAEHLPEIVEWIRSFIQ